MNAGSKTIDNSGSGQDFDLSSAGQFLDVAEACPDAILVVDRDWYFRYANQQCVDLLGVGRLVGSHLFTLFPGNYEEPYFSSYTRCMNERVATDFEAYYPEPLNCWFRVYARPFGASSIIIFFQDITARKEAELTREEILSGTEEGIIALNRELCVRYINRRASEMFGYSSPGRPGHTLVELLPMLAGSVLERSCRYALENQATVSFQERIAEPLNLWLDVDIRLSGVGILIFFRDLTEQHATSVALSSSEARLHLALTTTSGVGTWDWDVPSNLVYADETFARFYGVDPAKAPAGLPLESFTSAIHPDDHERVTRAITEAVRTGELYVSEHRLVQADASVRWISARGRCTYGPDRRPLRFPGVIFDITMRKQTEAALIQNEKLAAVGRLASSIAHEINNPLESVTNLIYLARNTEDVSEAKTYLSLAERELRRVAVIASQTLRFHRQSSRPRAVTCDELIEGTLSIYQGRLVNSGIAVEMRKRALRPVTCFEGEIRQVINNLIGNAIDAMGSAGGRLLLRSHETTASVSGVDGLVLTIADTGTGMSPKTVRKAFEAFYTTKGIGGTGLGLWISSEIVERHAGKLRVRSSQRPGGSGTVFRLFLPFQASNDNGHVQESGSGEQHLLPAQPR